MRRIVVGNWKMYLEKPEAAVRLASALKRKARSFSKVDVVIAPPFPFITSVKVALGPRASIRLGAQTLSAHIDGPHTGDVSGAMLASMGVSHVIVGHSERRAQGESDEAVHTELLNAAKAKLTAILCIGEHERDHVGGAHFTHIEQQLTSALSGLKDIKLMIAYEPVWAIGKSAAEAMQAAQLRETVIFIRKILVEKLGRAAALKVPILYGGSVEAENARTLIEEGDVAGFLVGHASVAEDTFMPILLACQKK